MKHLVIGAGATLAQAIALGNPPERCPPLIRDFARKMWMNYTPHPLLEQFLNALGRTNFGKDAREAFYQLESEGLTSIEHFLEFAWANRNDTRLNRSDLPPGYISGLRVRSPEAEADHFSNEFWDDLLYHGVGVPLSLLMIQCFFDNGKGWKDLAPSKLIASRLQAGDAVLNLNYDTVFELALEQLGCPFAYSPNSSTGRLLVCKPHGSLNMVVNATSFQFGQPSWLGMPEPRGFRSYSGIIPPKLNKDYQAHPIAKMILTPLEDRKPEKVVMWGVGLAESDVDLLNLYRRWVNAGADVDVINPSSDVAERARRQLGSQVTYFPSAEEWLDAS